MTVTDINNTQASLVLIFIRSSWIVKKEYRKDNKNKVKGVGLVEVFSVEGDQGE